MTPAEAVNLWNIAAPKHGWPTARQLKREATMANKKKSSFEFDTTKADAAARKKELSSHIRDIRALKAYVEKLFTSLGDEKGETDEEMGILVDCLIGYSMLIEEKYGKDVLFDVYL